ncbi:MAG TPA: hypothetical protein VIS10_00820 [Anaerolineales bacterium]
MSTTDNQALPTQPSLMTSLMAGFDAVTNHLELILFPIILDLFLWFGPHLRLKELVVEFTNQIGNLSGLDTPEVSNALQLNRELWLLVADRLNMFSALRAYPVGIPSLMASRQPLEAPLVQPVGWEVSSVEGAAVWWFILSVMGLVVGALFFVLVAQASLHGKIHWQIAIGQWPRSSLQVILLTLFIGILILAISIPGSCLITALTLTGLPVSQISLLLFGAVALWVLFPFLFSAHGIFTYQHKMWTSVRQGARVVRMTLPKTSLLFLSIVVISEGLDTLWRVPAENSWMSLIGVTGHAFVSTSLLAASFIYYRDATRWVQRLIQQSLMVESKKLRERIT